MKKYVAIILLIGIVLASVLVTNTVKVQEKAYKTFNDSGYVLQSKDDNQNQVERYYFSGDQKYKQNYKKEITFEDTNGTKVSTNNNNFIHYTDGSISAFKNGVLVDITTIDNDPIFYYNVLANQILTKKGDSYTIKNLDKYLTFNYLLWKIDDNKYLVAGKDLRLTFEDGTEKIINGFLEIEYCDNEVVKIYNQEIMYQTISEETILHIPENIKINLVTKIVSKDDENQMSLDTMAIDSEDNIPIVDLSEEEKKDENEVNAENVVEDQNTNNNNNSNNNNNEENNQNNSQIQNNNQSNSSVSGSGETIVDSNPEVIQTPKFKLASFDVTTTGVKASVEITDDEGLLDKNTSVKIFRVASGKVEFEKEVPLGEYQFQIETSESEPLSPDTEYILQVESSYQVDDIAYQKNFIYKRFKTNAIGVSFEKDVFTNQSLGFKIKFEPNSQITSVTLQATGPEGTEKVPPIENILNENLENGSEKIVTFNNLVSNTKYEILLTEVTYNGATYNGKFDSVQYFTTLKDIPTFGNNDGKSNVEHEINAKDGNFIFRIKNVQDSQNGIKGYKFEVYDTRVTDGTVAKTIETSESEILLPVDGKTIERGVGYYVQAYAIFDDNEKICEYNAGISDVVSLEAKQFPTVALDENAKITFERIEGIIHITDETGVIDTESTITVVLMDRFGKVQTTTAKSGLLSIPIVFNNLRKKESYTMQVFGRVDLDDDNDPIENCLIGTIVFTTTDPAPLRAIFKTVDTVNSNNEDGTPNKSTGDRFNTSFQLTTTDMYNDDLEAKTLTSITFSIYSGKIDPSTGKPSGALKKRITLKDTEPEPYSSSLKKAYYDNQIRITPTFFGAKDIDFKEKFYTVTVSGACDYTEYPNELPIIDNIFEIETKGSIPPTPGEETESFIVTPKYNYELSDEERDKDVHASSIVSFKVQAKYSASLDNTFKITYKAFDATTKKVVETQVYDIVDDGNGKVLPAANFKVGKGTNHNVVDEDGLRRGNQYFFTFEIEVDVNENGVIEDGEIYPQPGDMFDENGEYKFRTRAYAPRKQYADLIIYPSTSTETTRTYKYQLKDVDNYIIYSGDENNKYAEVIPSLGNTIKPSKQIRETPEDTFQTVTFDELENGDLRLHVSCEAWKYLEPIKYSIMNEYFEGTNSIENLRYSVALGNNSINIQLKDSNGNPTNIKNFNKIAGFKIRVEPTDPESTIEPYEEDLVTPSSSNILTVKFVNLANLIRQNVRVLVYAYYDSGVSGFDIPNENILLQSTYLSSESPDYFILRENAKKEVELIPNASTMGTIFKRLDTLVCKNCGFWYKGETPPTKCEKCEADGTEFIKASDDKLSIYNIMKTELQNNIQLDYSTITATDDDNTLKGLLFDGKAIMPKGVDEHEITNDGDNTVRFDLIIPGIDMTNSSGSLDILKSLDKISMKAQIINTGGTKIIDDKIYIELYNVDQDGKLTSTIPFRTVEKRIIDFNDRIDIDGLEAGKHYAMRVKAKILDVDGNIVDKYLYDVHFNEEGRFYFFETLSDVGISNITVRYNPVRYTDKYLQVLYNLTETQGYDHIEYVLKKRNFETGEYEQFSFTDAANLEDRVFKTAMEKNIPLGYGENCKFDFGAYYELTIIPVAYGANNTRVILGEKSSRFYIKKLSEPIIAVKGNRVYDGEKYNIEFKVSIYDTDRTIVGDTYKAILHDGTSSRELVVDGKSEFSITDLNRIFTIKDTDITKEYTLDIKTTVNYNNKLDIRDFTRSCTISAGNQYGITIGEISTAKNSKKETSIDLIFAGSDKLLDVDSVSYSIYNTSGYNVSASSSFSDKLTVTTSEVEDSSGNIVQENYYTFTIDPPENNTIKAEGSYYIVLNFIKNDPEIGGDVIIETRQVEYVYIASK